YQKGYAYINQAFPSELGVHVDLEFKIWRSNGETTGADGFSVFLFDASVDSFKIGGFGGSLGYAPFTNVGAPASSGVRGGYVGIGIDEFGNYSKGFEGRIGGEGFHANSIGVRGPTPDFEWLTGNFDLGFQLEHGNSVKRPADSVYFRRIQLEIIPVKVGSVNRYKIKVLIQNTLTGKFIDVLKPYLLPTAPPAMLKLGFAAATGSCTNFHEVRNLLIRTPGGVHVIKQVDKAEAKMGDELTYTMNIFNEADTFASGLMLKDQMNQLPSKFQITSVTFDKNNYPANMATGYSQTDFSNVTVSMEPYSRSTFIVKGKIMGYPTGGAITNTAIFNIGTSKLIDNDLSNDTSSVTTLVRDEGPLAVDDVSRTEIGIPVTIPVLLNDQPSISPLVPSSVEIITQTQHGSLSPHSDGTVVYTPNPGFFGDDLFTYKVKDANLKVSNVATVRIAIYSYKGVHVTKEVDKTEAEVGDELTYTLNIYNEADISASGLMFKDQMNQSPSKFHITSVNVVPNAHPNNTISWSSPTDPSQATVFMEANSQSTVVVKGNIVDFPIGGVITNTAIFNTGTSVLRDNDLSNDTSSVTTTIIYEGPYAIDDADTTDVDTPVTISILKNDHGSRPIDTLSVVIITDPLNGRVTVNPNGTVVYTPNPGYSGEDVFTYQVKDDNLKASNIASVTISIVPLDFFIPNIFTPNGDHINDFFEIRGLNYYYPDVELKVISRWGDEVYYNSDYHNNWDGNGLNEGTYYYSLLLRKNGKVAGHKVGWVLLKR
ncbi:MAG: Ig-like domain-containing protein, partial [Bacteroidales bacterium]|nr:Ig-like domain-containing protein [Bacteroidales bacterium]